MTHKKFQKGNFDSKFGNFGIPYNTFNAHILIINLSKRRQHWDMGFRSIISEIRLLMQRDEKKLKFDQALPMDDGIKSGEWHSIKSRTCSLMLVIGMICDHSCVNEWRNKKLAILAHFGSFWTRSRTTKKGMIFIATECCLYLDLKKGNLVLFLKITPGWRHATWPSAPICVTEK